MQAWPSYEDFYSALERYNLEHENRRFQQVGGKGKDTSVQFICPISPRTKQKSANGAHNPPNCRPTRKQPLLRSLEWQM
eukprot:5302068-Pleurochrysis_carterae.AAC.1